MPGDRASLRRVAIAAAPATASVKTRRLRLMDHEQVEHCCGGAVKHFPPPPAALILAWIGDATGLDRVRDQSAQTRGGLYSSLMPHCMLPTPVHVVDPPGDSEYIWAYR